MAGAIVSIDSMVAMPMPTNIIGQVQRMSSANTSILRLFMRVTLHSLTVSPVAIPTIPFAIQWDKHKPIRMVVTKIAIKIKIIVTSTVVVLNMMISSIDKKNDC
jgi:hypothetical protein